MRDDAAPELSTEEQRNHHDKRDPHVRSRWLSDVVLGAQDGLVNTLGVVLGVAAASADARVVFAAGMAAGLAESFSMAAVGYTSSVARGDLFRSEREREYRHVEATPGLEREEVRAIYVRKGFHGELLADITPADVHWTCQRLARLSDRQWQDAFRAGGFAAPAAERFIRRMKQKINEGLALKE